MPARLTAFLENRPKLTYTLILTYLAIIFILSSMPAPPSPTKDYDMTLYISTLEHIAEYAILGYLTLTGLRIRQQKINTKKTIFAAIAFCFLWGLSDEIHQYFIPTRDGNVLDVAADYAGSLIGIFIGIRSRKKKAANDPAS